MQIVFSKTHECMQMSSLHNRSNQHNHSSTSPCFISVGKHKIWLNNNYTHIGAYVDVWWCTMTKHTALSDWVGGFVYSVNLEDVCVVLSFLFPSLHQLIYIFIFLCTSGATLFLFNWLATTPFWIHLILEPKQSWTWSVPGKETTKCWKLGADMDQ